MTLFVSSGRSPPFAIICKRKCYVSFSNVFIITCTRIAREKCGVTPEQEKAFDIVRRFYILVDQHFREKKQVQDYADLLFRSPKTLSNLFASCGVPSPLRIIHERIESEAKKITALYP